MSTKDGIASVLCPDCLALLIDVYGGRVIRVPTRAPIDHDAIRADLDAGGTYRAVAAKHGVRLQTVCNAGKR